jgi:hypothetical protein
MLRMATTSIDTGAPATVRARIAPASFAGVFVAPNVEAQPDHWPVTGLPF